MAVGRHHRPFHRLCLAAHAELGGGEAPLIGRDHLRGVIRIAPPGQHRLTRVERDRGIGMRRDPAAEREAGDPRNIGDVFDANAAGDRLAVVGRHRHVEHHAPIARQNVAFPCKPRHRIAPSHEKPIAGMRQGDRRVAVRRVIVELQCPLMPPVAIIVEHTPVAALHLDRPQDHEVTGEVHHAIRLDRRLLEVHHVPLCRARASTAKCARPDRRSYVPTFPKPWPSANDIRSSIRNSIRLVMTAPATSSPLWMARSARTRPERADQRQAWCPTSAGRMNQTKAGQAEPAT